MIISTYNLFNDEWLVYTKDDKAIHKGFAKKMTLITILHFWLRVKLYKIGKKLKSKIRGRYAG